MAPAMDVGRCGVGARVRAGAGARAVRTAVAPPPRPKLETRHDTTDRTTDTTRHRPVDASCRACVVGGGLHSVVRAGVGVDLSPVRSRIPWIGYPECCIPPTHARTTNKKYISNHEVSARGPDPLDRARRVAVGIQMSDPVASDPYTRYRALGMVSSRRARSSATFRLPMSSTNEGALQTACRVSLLLSKRIDRTLFAIATGSIEANAWGLAHE